MTNTRKTKTPRSAKAKRRSAKAKRRSAQSPGRPTTRLSLLRQHRRWSQAELSQRAEIDSTLICRFELGRRKPAPGSITLRRIARALGLPDSEADTLLDPPAPETIRHADASERIVGIALGLT